MSIRLIKVNGRKVWQARVAYRGHRKSAIRELDLRTRMEARETRGWVIVETTYRAGVPGTRGVVRGGLESRVLCPWGRALGGLDHADWERKLDQSTMAPRRAASLYSR